MRYFGAMTRTKKADWSLEQRLFAKRRIDPNSGCWIYTGFTQPNGYAQLGVKPFPQFGIDKIGVHRLAHILWIGPIPKGFEVHHKEEVGCTSKACFNPAHLLATDAPTHHNDLSTRNASYINKRKTECLRGHPLSGDNLRLQKRRKSGRVYRVCRTCEGEAWRRYESRRQTKND